MKYLSILITLALALTIGGCSQEETKPAPAATPASKPQAVQQAEQVAEQAKERVAEVEQQVMAMTATDTSSATASGQAIYSKSCAVCHKLGIAGAPKTGDKAAWGTLIASGIDQLVKNAINGKGKMPAKGGNSKLSDDEVKASVEYMMEQGK